MLFIFFQHPSVPTNIILGWKGLPGTNTLAYYEASVVAQDSCFPTLVSNMCSSIEITLK